jgi:hypothetical protein
MPMGLIFWITFLIGVIFGGITAWPGPFGDRVRPFGNWVLLILIFLLGWKSFGFIIQ